MYEYCDNVDDEGTYYKLAALMDQQKFEKFVKLKRVDGVWKKENVPWNQTLLDYMKKLDKYWYLISAFWRARTDRFLWHWKNGVRLMTNRVRTARVMS